MTIRDRYWQWTLLAGLAVLLAIKAWLPMRDSPRATLDDCLLSAAIFGAPQLIWIARIGLARSNAAFLTAKFLIVVFVIIYARVGYFPGMSPANLGQAHFEVPIAFGVELVAALVALAIPGRPSALRAAPREHDPPRSTDAS